LEWGQLGEGMGADAWGTGFALAVAPVIWDNLSEKERGNLEAWLGNSINEKK
jgi:hypothetical protein